MPLNVGALRQNLAARQGKESQSSNPVVGASAAPAKSANSGGNWSGERSNKRRTAGKPEDIHKSPPHSVEAEQGVIGSILVSKGSAMPDVLRELPAKHFFYVPAHVTIYECLCDMWDSGQALDLITFTQFLRDRKKLDEVGGAAGVTNLFTFVPTAANILYYTDIVREKFFQREMISLGTQMVRASYGEQDTEVIDLVQSFSNRIERIKLAAGGTNGVHELTTTQLRDMKGVPDKNVLVGNRWLVRGGNCLWAGGAGYGKSSLTMQLAVYWACGQSVFGLRPHFPLKSLIIQAENDDFDMAEQYNGVLEGIAATGDLDITSQSETIDSNLIVLRMEGVSGFPFLSKLADLLQLYRPAVLWLDPLFAFSGCDLLDAEKVGHFLREGLFPLFTKYNCCGQVIHHVGKPPRTQDNQDRSALDEQYLSFGTSEIQNAFRAVNILKPPTKTIPAFRLVFSKRGERAGAKAFEGERTNSIFIDHSHPHICWVQVAEPEKPAGRGFVTKYDPKDILDEMSVTEGKSVKDLQEHVAHESGMSRAVFYRHWKDLKSSGKVRVDSDGKWFPKRLNAHAE